MSIRQLTAALTTACFLSLSVHTTANAAIIGPAQYLHQQDRAAQLSRIDAMLARADVVAQLEHLGVSPLDASERARLLTDQELQTLASRIDTMPAGGDSVLVVIGIVFLVLLILELTGATDIFKRI